MENKESIILLTLLAFVGVCEGANLTLDTGDYQMCFYYPNNELIDCYMNETITIGLNDYIIQLEEQRINKTPIEMMYYTLDTISFVYRFVVMMSVIIGIIIVGLMVYYIWI